MKKKFLFLAILLSILSVNLSYAQGKPKVLKTSFGAKVGLNLSTISNGQSNINFTPDMTPGFHVGAIVNMHFGYRNEGSPVGTGIFALQPELLYSMQGFKTDDVNVNLSYITLPIMAKFYLFKGLNLEVGPYFSYMIAASPDTTVLDGAQIDISSLKGGFDVGASAGIGLELGFGLVICARYNLGLTQMAENIQWKNNVIAVSVGWLF